MRRAALFVTVLLLTSAAQTTHAGDFRATAPSIAAAPALAPSMIREARLPNGLRVLVVEQHGIPVVAIRIASGVGSLRAPLGLACLAARTWAGGGSLDAGELGKAVRKIGALHGSFARWDSTQIWTTVLAPALDRAIELSASAALAPSFESEDVNNRRDHELRALEDERWSASDAFHEVLYAPGDSRHERFCGNRAAIEGVTAAQLEEQLARAFDPARTTLIVVGDVTFDAVTESARHWLAAAPAHSSAPVADPPAPRSAAKRALLLVDREGSTQSTIALGAVTEPRASASTAALDVLAEALEGRIELVLRDQLGLTYGFRVNPSAGRSGGEIVIEGKIETSRTGESLRVLLAEVERLRTEPLDAHGLALAKARVSYRDPRYEETSRATAEALARLVTEGLPLDTWAHEASAVAAVTSDDVLRVARTYLDPARVPIVVVGDAGAIRASLPDVGGPVTVVKR